MWLDFLIRYLSTLGKCGSCLTLQVRYRRDHLSGRTLQYFPLLDDLLKDISDGTALLAVIHFYCPEFIRLEGTVTLGY